MPTTRFAQLQQTEDQPRARRGVRRLDFYFGSGATRDWAASLGPGRWELEP